MKLCKKYQKEILTKTAGTIIFIAIFLLLIFIIKQVVYVGSGLTLGKIDEFVEYSEEYRRCKINKRC